MFKPGDQIRCINDYFSCLKVGKLYTFKSYDPYDINYLYIEDETKRKVRYYSSRFEAVEENKKEKETKMFKCGDKIRCIDNLNIENYLELGKIYIFECYLNDNKFLYIRDNLGTFNVKRFELVEENEVKDDKPEMEVKEEKYIISDSRFVKTFSSKEEAIKFFEKEFNDNINNNSITFNKSNFLISKVVSEIYTEKTFKYKDV